MTQWKTLKDTLTDDNKEVVDILERIEHEITEALIHADYINGRRVLLLEERDIFNILGAIRAARNHIIVYDLVVERE